MRQMLFLGPHFTDEDSEAHRGTVIILWEGDLGDGPKGKQVATLHLLQQQVWRV